MARSELTCYVWSLEFLDGLWGIQKTHQAGWAVGSFSCRTEGLKRGPVSPSLGELHKCVCVCVLAGGTEVPGRWQVGIGTANHVTLKYLLF